MIDLTRKSCCPVGVTKLRIQLRAIFISSGTKLWFHGNGTEVDSPFPAYMRHGATLRKNSYLVAGVSKNNGRFTIFCSVFENTVPGIDVMYCRTTWTY